MKLLLRAYPCWWRARYGDELLALLEAQPLTWRVRADVVVAGLGERLRGSGPPQLRVLWAWALFVIGGMGFQKTSEHWQVVVPSGNDDVAPKGDTVVDHESAAANAWSQSSPNSDGSGHRSTNPQLGILVALVWPPWLSA